MANSASERTKRNLAAVLKEKMAKKPLEQITIQELTEACGMQRRAFYYHFEDIYALVKWMFQEEAISLLQQQEGMLLWQEGLLQLFHYLEENKAVCLCALRSSGHDALKRFFGADLEGIFSKEMKKMAWRLDLDLDPHGIPLFVSALGGIVEASFLIRRRKWSAGSTAFYRATSTVCKSCSTIRSGLTPLETPRRRREISRHSKMMVRI